MKTYKINYRLKRDKNNVINETMVTADNVKEARKLARQDLENIYTIIMVKLEK